MATEITGGKAEPGFEYDTLAGDVCVTCGCVVADLSKHTPCPTLTIASLKKRVTALEAKK